MFLKKFNATRNKAFKRSVATFYKIKKSPYLLRIEDYGTILHLNPPFMVDNLDSLICTCNKIEIKVNLVITSSAWSKIKQDEAI